MFEADSAQLERALANVVENAVRHAGSEPVRIAAQRIGPAIAIRVTDHGPGISRAELERVFEPFHAAGEAAAAPASGWRSRAASSRRTGAACAPSRCPARGRPSRSCCRPRAPADARRGPRAAASA